MQIKPELDLIFTELEISKFLITDVSIIVHRGKIFRVEYN